MSGAVLGEPSSGQQPQRFGTSVDDNEQQPLIPATEQPKVSQRGIGSGVASSEGGREVRYGTESQLQRKLYEIHKKYRVFIHNSKWILNILILLNTIVLILKLISDFFFNVGGFLGTSNRFLSFNDITLVFISIIANLFNLWFNKLGLYSSLDCTLNIILCLLTLFNLELLYIVGYTRHRIGFVGSFVYLWATLSFFVGIVLDWYLIDYNKRLSVPFEDGAAAANNTGSEERRQVVADRNAAASSDKHTMREWMYIGSRNIVKILLLVFFLLFTLNNVLSAWDIQRVSRKINDSEVATSAATYDAFHWVDDEHTYKLHIKCYGDVYSEDDSEQPIILYEHGGYDTGYSSARWIEELYHLNKIHRYCSYERPGYGLSDSPPAPISISMVADALRYSLVKSAKIEGPFVTVGYDLGGLFTQVFTAKNLDIVHSMLLVESWHEKLLLKNYIQRLLPPDHDGDDDDRDFYKLEDFEDLVQFMRGDDGDDKVGVVPQELRRHNEFKLWWHGMWSTIGLRLQTSWLFAHHGSYERVYGRDMKYQGKFIRAKFLESVTSSLLSYKDVVNNKEKLDSVKTSIVSSKDMVKKSSVWGNWQRELTKISHNTKEWKVVDGGHEVYKYGVGAEQTQEVLLRLIGALDN